MRTLRRLRDILAVNYYVQWLCCRLGWHDWGTYGTRNGDSWTRCVLCAKRPTLSDQEQR